ncbi:MAG: CGNR zinc finger domain-containing protein [Candidatus Binataceae bacterium]|nr:CGNR zinc finger domain-containing protein [Candidatus Binataceae bacterium]
MSASRKLTNANDAAIVERPEPMGKQRILAWLVDFSRIAAASLTKGRPGDLPNLIYELRQWLDLEPDEPLNKAVRDLEKAPARLQAIVDRVAELLGAVADRKRFRMDYSGGGVILDAGKLGSDGGRALSYRDANLEDAVLRVALDDLYEDIGAALRIQRCEELECARIFLAEQKHQKYCSHRCANKTASRAYRLTHGKERAERERDRYERKVKARTASKVKVGRRVTSKADS